MAGTAPPVMLTIWRPLSGPRAKREKGMETETPCCSIKFELSKRKKMSRKAMFTSATSTTQPKFKFAVRLSFMTAQHSQFSDSADPGSDRRFRARRFLGLLKTDDAADRPAFS